MQSYQFENKEQDKDFLSGKLVTCRIAVSRKEEMAPGEIMVVILSNGKKYKGKVSRLNVFEVASRTIGEMEVCKV